MEILALVIVFFVVVFAFMTVRIVPQQFAYVVERLGKYDRTLHAGPHVIFPIVDRVRYRHSLKELVLDIPEQPCITRDNVQIGVDGVIFMRVMDPARASYGVSNYQLAVVQIAQTSLRSEFGKLDLDRTFEERVPINTAIVNALDKATEAWGVKVLRYEIRSITPPREVVEAMEKQMRAEREKRAIILASEGQRDAAINVADGQKQEVIKASEAIQQKQINEAEGQASAIRAIATASAQGLAEVAKTLGMPGGADAARLRVAEDWVKQFGNLAKRSNTMIVPANVGDIAGILASAMAAFDQVRKAGSSDDKILI